MQQTVFGLDPMWVATLILVFTYAVAYRAVAVVRIRPQDGGARIHQFLDNLRVGQSAAVVRKVT